MNAFIRKLALVVALVCCSFALGVDPALAKTAHHTRPHAKTHHPHTRAKASRTVGTLRNAQLHLSNLGYYTGKLDGVMGRKTRESLKRFQRDHGLKADGVLGRKTMEALERADHLTNTPPPFLVHEAGGAAPVSSSSAVNPDYTNSLGGSTQVISSRFASVDVTEDGAGADKRYRVNLNGSAIFTSEGQPSVMRISPTYDLGNEEAIIFTTYSPDAASGCVYKNHVLVLNNAGGRILDIDNCTREYEARVDQGSLYISFPERDYARVLGAVWRLQGDDLVPL